MRLTKTGKPHAHSRNAQDFTHAPADPRQMLRKVTEGYIGMLERWDDGSAAVTVAWKACKNLLERLERESS